MRKYFYQVTTLCSMYQHLFLKMLFFGFIIMCCLWHFVLKRPVYQRLYATPDPTPLTIMDADIFQDLPEQQVLPFRINGYDIEIQAIKSFSTIARVTYVDRYNKLGTWFRSHEGAALYDAVVPQDISLATGATGRNYQCFKFTHEYRMGGSFTTYKCGQNWQQDFPSFANDISNNHSIAATQNVQRGIDILKAGDIAHIEGYLIYWNGMGKLRYQRFESAIIPNQISNQIVSGQHPQLCRQLLITKITFDGYTFE